MIRYTKVSPLIAESEIKVQIRTRKGKLYVDYYVDGQRVRRSTGLDDSVINRKTIKKEIIPKIQAKILLGEYGQRKAQPLSAYIPRFLVTKEDMKSYDVKKSRSKVIEKELGKIPVDRITRSYIKEFIAQFNDRPYTKKEYLGDLRGILEIALDDEVIQVNVARNVKVGKLGKPKIDPFSPEEVQAIMKYAHGIFKSFLGISFNTGARSGEVLGLMRNDIGNQLHIRRTVTRNSVNEPKTIGSVRSIPIFDVIEPFLDERLEKSKSLYLFDKDGGNLGDIGYFRRQWQTVIKKSGVRYRKLYNTRHTFITAMLNSGQFSILQIAQMVGHASPRMIMSTYAGYVQSEHLKIDVKTDLFGHNMGTVEKKVKSYTFKKASGSS